MNRRELIKVVALKLCAWALFPSLLWAHPPHEAKPDSYAYLSRVVGAPPPWGKRWDLESLSWQGEKPPGSVNEDIVAFLLKEPGHAASFSAEGWLLSRSRAANYFGVVVDSWEDVLSPLGEPPKVDSQLLWNYILDHSDDVETALIVALGLRRFGGEIRALRPSEKDLDEIVRERKMTPAQRARVEGLANRFAAALRFYESTEPPPEENHFRLENFFPNRSSPHANPRPYPHRIIEDESPARPKGYPQVGREPVLRVRVRTCRGDENEL
ncbi:MAG: hypothetical protein R3B54_16970 [Bdellovibrionota bacterium]